MCPIFEENILTEKCLAEMEIYEKQFQENSSLDWKWLSRYLVKKSN
jgi:hypothetical protein